jgi:hypothetical protein
VGDVADLCRYRLAGSVVLERYAKVDESQEFVLA